MISAPLPPIAPSIVQYASMPNRYVHTPPSLRLASSRFRRWPVYSITLRLAGIGTLAYTPYRWIFERRIDNAKHVYRGSILGFITGSVRGLGAGAFMVAVP